MLSSKRIFNHLAIACCLLGSISTADAAVRTFEYTAEGTFLSSINDYLGVDITFVNGTFRFDDSAPADGAAQSFTGFSRQNYDGSSASMTAELRENENAPVFASYSATNANISVRDGTSGIGDAGSLNFQTISGANIDGLPSLTSIGVDLFDGTDPNLFDSLLLASFADVIEAWPLGSSEFEIRFAGSGGFVENGGSLQFTSLTEVTVPLPAAVYLFGSALLFGFLT